VLSRARLQEGLAEVESKYKRKGYIYWFAEPQYQSAPKDHVVDVVLRMFEGEQFRLGRLEFTGNTSTKDKVLRRQVVVDEGQVLDMDAFRKSILKISQLGYFKLARIRRSFPTTPRKSQRQRQGAGDSATK